jgi:hypothetical protein
VFQSLSVDYYLQISTTVPRLAFLTHFADIFHQYSTHYQDDAGLFDSARACNDVMRLAFTNRPEFLLKEISVHASTTTSTTTSKKRKRIESSELDPTCRRGRILARGYPFLMRLQIFLMNDERVKAYTLAKQMELCCALSEDERAQAWGFVMNYLQDMGQVFLDDNDRHSRQYQEKRQSLIFLRQHMGNLGLDTLLDSYKLLIEEVSKDPYATPQEIHYVTTASQHTVLRLLMLVNVDDGIKRTLDEFPSLYVWGDDMKAKRNWAMNFLQTPNAIPESLLVDGQVDLRSLLNRAPKENEVAPPPVPVEEEIEIEVVDEAPAQVLQEQEVEEILDSSEEVPADQEAYSAEEAKEPEVEEILDSSDEEPAEEQEVEEIFDSSDDEVGQQSYSDEQEFFEETIDSSDDEPVGQQAYSDDEADDEQLEESLDSDEYSAGQEAYPANEIVEIVDSSSDDAEEQVSGTEQEVGDSESEPPERQTRGGEETSDEDEVVEQKVEDHESEPRDVRRTRDGEETADEDDVADLFGSIVAGERLEAAREAIDDYDDVESSDEGMRGSFEGEEEAQGVMEHDEDSSDEEDVHEQERHDVEQIVDSSETEDMASGADQGDDQYSSDDEEVALEEQGDQDLSEDEVVVIDDEESKEADEAEPEKGGEEDHLADGYEPDTAGQTESEEDDDDRRASNGAPATRKALGSDQIACRTTFSDMDAADERDESSGVDDNVRKERPTFLSKAMDSEASSTLVAFAQSAQRDASVSREEEYEAHTSPSRPPPPRRPAVEELVVDILPDLEPHDGDNTSAAVAASDADRYLSEAGTASVVDAVPRIDDVHVGEDDTTATVALSDASQSLASQALAETTMMETAQEREEAQEHVGIVNQVPTVEAARLGDDTSATVAASEAGRYLSEANTECIDIEKHEKFPCAANEVEKDSHAAVEDSSSIDTTEAKGKSDSDLPRRASDGVLSDRAGYEANEEKTDVENSARSLSDKTEVENSARSVSETETTGYEADIEEKTPLFIPAVTTVDVRTETPGPGYESDAEEKGVPEVEGSQPEPSHSGDSSGIPTEKATGVPDAQEDESASIHPEIVSTSVTVAETERHEPLAGPSAQVAAAKSDDSSEHEAEEPKVDSVSSAATRDDETGIVAASSQPSALSSAQAAAESDETSENEADEPTVASVVAAAQDEETGSVAGSNQRSGVPSAHAEAESDDIGNDAEEVKVDFVSSAAIRDDETGSVAASSQPSGVPSARAAAESDDSWNEAEEPKVASVSSVATATHDDETGSVAASSQPSGVPSAHTAAESDESSENEAEEHTIASVSTAVATRDAGSVTSSVPKSSRRKATSKQESDFEYYGPAAKKKRSETETKEDDVSASAPAVVDGVDAKEIAEFVPSIPTSTTAGEHDASSAHPRSDNAAETDTKPHAIRHTTRRGREKNDDDSDGASSVSEPSRPTTRGRTASSLRTRSHDPSVETESKDSATAEKGRATRNSRAKKGSDEEVEIDMEGSSDEHRRIMALKVADLRVELRQQGLDTSGLKKELQSRLLRNVEETIKGLGSPERHTRSHDSAARSSRQSIQGLDSPAGHTRSHDSPVSTRHSRATRTKNDDEASSKTSTTKSKTAWKAATKKSETDSVTSLADSKASTKKSGTRSSTKRAKSEADSENRDSLGSNPEGRAISFPEDDEENNDGSVSSMESSVASPTRSRPARAVTRRTSLATVPENEDSGSVVSSVRGRPKRAAAQGGSLATVPDNDSGETLSASTARMTRSRRSNVNEAPAKRRKSNRSVASAASTTRSGRKSRSRSGRP